jgi:hypothetical protein
MPKILPTAWIAGSRVVIGISFAIPVKALCKLQALRGSMAPWSGLELTTLRLIADTSECRVFFRSESKQESSWVLDQRLDLGVNRESLSQGLAPGMKSESG